MPAVTTINSSGDIYTDGLLGNLKWAINDFTYSFPTGSSLYGTSYGEGETATFGTLTSLQQTTARTALSMVASVANLTFTEITETATAHADLRFGLSNLPSTAWAYFPTTDAEGGDAWFNKSSGAYSKPVKGNYAFVTFIHEIGHALGLEHPHEAGLPGDRDSMEYTVMSYRSYIDASTTGGYANEAWGYAQSLMMLDIAALQHLYGADYTTNSTGTVYRWSTTTGEMFVDGIGQGAPGGNRILLTIWDGGGSDTYDFSNYGTNLKVDLRPGNWTTTATGQLAKLRYDGSRLAAGNIANALLHQGDTRSLIENAFGGTGADVIVGNQAANTLKGNAGNDRLTGAEGNDLIDGGTGSDTAILGGRRSDSVVTLLADGSLQVSDLRTGASNGTDIIRNIEMLQFSDRAYSLAELTAPSQTVMTEPPIVEIVAEEPPVTDEPLVLDRPPVTVDLPAKQDLVLTGTGAADRINGGTGNDTIDGQGGNDILTGGSGGDILDGGTGTDTASYATSGTGVTADLMAASRNTRDASGDRYASIENLTGSAYADVLKGNNAANALGGGSGADSLYGRGGSDRLDGYDGNDNLEGGGGADRLYGRSGRDTLYGGAGADVLSGGTGADLFVFKTRGESTSGGRDTIQDFVSGTDRIDLRSIDASTKNSGNQAFSFIGGDAFTAKAGQLKFRDSLLSGDVNGDAVADFQIRLSKVLSLKSADFYL
ncbi:M10 family metallopeptidase C-terminal domain-containing protein [Microvirga sp. CF3062]|uniref:M10 family metallopeptidase C-terminal domain-containing protein n=1 Tax=Microvirga sp. CF3062 TaxID=3110182 RepID=UPI002E7A7280|nr:M10 family metallopeptidase C-terminal domain-containing protein [Microvirga sp. CF3062]MEE1657907.1 M10 family metallopeptidase C-terminal domain-containing protein [Microvirga sp. CF3062]